jgi:hypothetical protein
VLSSDRQGKCARSRGEEHISVYQRPFLGAGRFHARSTAEGGDCCAENAPSTRDLAKEFMTIRQADDGASIGKVICWARKQHNAPYPFGQIRQRTLQEAQHGEGGGYARCVRARERTTAEGSLKPPRLSTPWALTLSRYYFYVSAVIDVVRMGIPRSSRQARQSLLHYL